MVTLPDAAVVVPEVAAGVVREERGGEDVSVGAGVVATDVDVGVLAGVVVPPAGSLPLPAPLLGVTLVLAEALQLPPAGVAVEAVLTVSVLHTAELAVATLVTGVTPPHTAPAGAVQQLEVAVVGLSRHEVASVAVVGPAKEEMIVDTPGVVNAGSFSFLAGVGGQTARLTAVVLGVPEAALAVAVVVPADEADLAVRVPVTVSLPGRAEPHVVPDTAALTSPAPHLQPLGLRAVHHDGHGGLARRGVLQEGEPGQLAGGGGLVIVVTVTQPGLLLPVVTVVGTGQVGLRLQAQTQHGGELSHGNVTGGFVLTTESVDGDQNGESERESDQVEHVVSLTEATLMTADFTPGH